MITHVNLVYRMKLSERPLELSQVSVVAVSTTAGGLRYEASIVAESLATRQQSSFGSHGLFARGRVVLCH